MYNFRTYRFAFFIGKAMKNVLFFVYLRLYVEVPTISYYKLKFLTLFPASFALPTSPTSII